MNNKYFSKALFYCEKNNIIGSALAYSFIFFILILNFISGNYVHKFSMPNSFTTNVALVNIPLQVMLIIAIVSVYESYNNKEIKYPFLLTQPYSRDSIILTKTAAYMTGYTIPIILYAVISTILITANKEIFGQLYGTLLSLLFLRLFALFAILTLSAILVQLMQMFFGKNSAALFIPLTIGFMVPVSIGLIYELTSSKLRVLKGLFNSIHRFIFYNETFIGHTFYPGMIGYINHYLKTSNAVISLALIALSVLILYICILLNRRIKSECISDLFLFKFSETLFKAIASLFITVFITFFSAAILFLLYKAVKGTNLSTDLIIKYGLKGKENIENTIYLIINILWIPIILLLYKLIGFFINKRRSL